MSKRFNLSVLSAAAISVATMLPIAAHAQAASKADLVSLKSAENGAEQVLTFEFAGAKPTARTFQLANPHRVVIDFAGALNHSQSGSMQYQGIGVQSLDLAGDETRLRAVLTLREDSQIIDRWNGNQYVLTVVRKGAKPVANEVKPMAAPVVEAKMAPAAAPTMAAETPAMAATKANQNQAMKLAQEILKLDFRKGRTAGSGRLIVDLTNSDTPIDIKSAKGGLVIDFMNTTVPANLARKFDVADQMTPVSSMEIKQLPDRTRLLIRAQGKWEQSAYQMENRFVFDVKPVFNDSMSKDNNGDSKAFKGDKLTLNFQNVEVRTILQVLSDFSGLNIITSDSVGGNLTLRLKEVPWDQAMDLILQSKKLDQRRSGNVIWVAPQAEITQKEQEDAKLKSAQAENLPLATESFEINYAKAPEVKALLETTGKNSASILSSRGNILVDQRTNTLFVQDIGPRLESIRAMIKKIDIPVRQVMIEARIVEATDSFGKSLGARIGFNQSQPNSIGNGKFFIGGGLSNTANTSGQGSGAAFADTYMSQLPAQGNGGNNPGLLSLVLFNKSATKFLNLELSALVSDGRGQILSNPRIITADKQEASIEQGTQIPYQSASSSGATSVSFKNATLALRVTPQITPGGDVNLTLSVNKDSVGVNTSAGPSIDTKAIKTQVLIEDGGTVVIGGIYTQDDLVNESRVPFFGDLPYIGNLFKTRTTTRDKKEMLVFITPKIIADKAVNDDLDAATVKEDLIKPILMDQETVNSKNGIKFFPSLPNDKTKKTRADLE